MHCCGNQGQVIELRGGDEPLCLVRCSGCERREWRVAGRAVPTDVALGLLGSAYRALPRAARAARERTASQATARAAVRRARTAAAAPAPRAVDARDLAGLLHGWTVLGAGA